MAHRVTGGRFPADDGEEDDLGAAISPPALGRNRWAELATGADDWVNARLNSQGDVMASDSAGRGPSCNDDYDAEWTETYVFPDAEDVVESCCAPEVHRAVFGFQWLWWVLDKFNERRYRSTEDYSGLWEDLGAAAPPARPARQARTRQR
jgi:hypothetical protein